MIRFILKKTRGFSYGYEDRKQERLFTLDLEVVELQRILRQGGYSESGYEYEFVDLIGVEVLEDKNDEKA